MPSTSKAHFNLKDLTGQRFGKLVVIKDSGERLKSRDVIWDCVCDCGTEKGVIGSHLRAGKVRACGCVRREKHSIERKAKTAQARRRVGVAIAKGYNSYVQAARSRGLSFDLSREEFLEIAHQDCYYCGGPPSMVKHSMFERAILNGIDRLDSALGYFKANCVPCCTMCNRMKNKFSEQEFLGHVARIFLHSKLWGVKKVA